MAKRPIEVWPFHDAPEELRGVLFDNGGDEDWLAIVPPEMLSDDAPYPSWLEHGSFGCCCINRYGVSDDGTLMHAGGYDERTDGLKWEWFHDRPKLPRYAGYEFRVGCHA